jgi:TPP-dependent pyruvate/acetoin dehydrogenase alpha subunit
MTESETDLYLGLYRSMRTIRRFEDTCLEMYSNGLIHGTTHLYSGQEAVSVGVASVLQEQDRVAATYRGHGASLALGISPDLLLAELCGRATGVCGGRAGSMNVIDLEHRLIGCFGIVGGSIAAATGAALALKRRGGVAVAFFGDGAVNHAYFYECLNFCKVFSLPVVFVCENNLYGEFTPWEAVTSGEISARPIAMGIATQTIDGNDVWAVRKHAAAAADQARSGAGPVFLEALTYRFVGHSRADPGTYRKEGEMQRWQQKDPLAAAANRLREAHAIDSAEIEAIDAEVEAALEAARRFAEASPFPDPAEPTSEFKES